jgi:DNA-binding transcriptional ArsR family regulator
MTAPFTVLAEPHRRRILDLLLEQDRPVGDLVEETALSQPAVSKHLKVLRDAGLVDVRIDAQRRIYSVNGGPLRAVDEWLAPYRRLWAERLQALEAHLNTMEGDTT